MRFDLFSSRAPDVVTPDVHVSIAGFAETSHANTA